MDYAQAVKEIQSLKKEAKPPFLRVTFNYDKRYVFPYKEGIAFVSALEHAEQVFESYREPSNIGELDSCIEITPMSHKEYMAYKVSNLLQITLEDARNLQSNRVKHDRTDPF